jgi:phosphatidylglycerophosphate synthase
MEHIPSKSLSRLLDPINRLYRHRVAKRIAHLLKNTGVSANHVTLVHTLVGVFAALLIYRSHYLGAVALFEIRTILDTTDGILARLKKQATPFGRTLDTIADGITFNSVMLAGALRMILDFPTYRPSIILILVFFFAMTAAHCGSVYQLMKRKLGSIIMEQIDSVEREWREQGEKVRVEPEAWIARFGFWLDTLTIRFVSEEWYEKINRRRLAEDWEVRALSDATTMNELARRTRRREFENAVRFTAFVSDDNILAVISLCFVVLEIFPNGVFPYVHPVLIAFSCGFFYAVVALALGLHFLHGFYHGVYRD